VLPFDVVTICQTDYRIDEFQHKIFILESPQQLYQCLDDFEQALLQSYH
jgi:phenylalanine-4-hydroxylase